MIRRAAVIDATRIAAALVGFALLATGTASGQDPQAGPNRGPRVAENSGPGWTSSTGYADPALRSEQFPFGGSEPTGGATFQETLGGRAAELAAAFGFDVEEVYGGFFVATATAGNGMFDAVLFCNILNGTDPSTGAEPDFFLRPPEGSQSNGFVLPSSFGRSQFLRQSALTFVHARTAHRMATGDGVVVAVLDTGIDRSHSMFAARVADGLDLVDGDDDPSEGIPDGIDQDGDGRADDGFGHGTTVAGLVLAAAPNATILPVRVLDVEGRGTAGRVAAGIRYATDHGAQVINLSLGADGYSPAIHDAIARARDWGLVVVAAAGNVRGAPAPQFPASEWGVIAATGNLGVPGDVWAPASNVAGPYPGELWFRGTGTSFAAALVSGGVALAEQRRPGLSAFDVVASLAAFRRGTFRLDLARLAQ